MGLRASEMVGIMLDLYKKELAVDGVGDDLCVTSLMPGASLIIDYVDCGGMAWIRLVDAYNTVAFPRADGSERNCAVGHVGLTMEIGLVRPAPLIESVNNEPVPPTEDEQNAATLRQLDEMEVMKAAISRISQHSGIRVVIGSYSPIGPDGDALGGSWSFAATAEDF